MNIVLKPGSHKVQCSECKRHAWTRSRCLNCQVVNCDLPQEPHYRRHRRQSQTRHQCTRHRPDSWRTCCRWALSSCCMKHRQTIALESTIPPAQTSTIQTPPDDGAAAFTTHPVSPTGRCVLTPNIDIQPKQFQKLDSTWQSPLGVIF